MSHLWHQVIKETRLAINGQNEFLLNQVENRGFVKSLTAVTAICCGVCTQPE